MKLEFVSVAGFRGFRDAVRVDIPSGFAVICGRNGAGKSTIIDAIDFALTGTINKFTTSNAKGGGLSEHIWWVGSGAKEHYVTVGFLSDDGGRYSVTRTRDGVSYSNGNPLEALCQVAPQSELSCEALVQTTIIRDELISSESMDLPGQARFSALRDAIGVIAGSDYTERAKSIVNAAERQVEDERRAVDEVRIKLGAALSTLTETRGEAERSKDFSGATQIIAAYLEDGQSVSPELARQIIVTKRQNLQRLSHAYAMLKEVQRDRADDFEGDLQQALENLSVASEAVQQAARDVTAATEALKEERSIDELASHYSELLSHGSALGLQDGHCPLCNAERSEAQFAQSISDARTVLADHGKRIEELVARLDEANKVFKAASASMQQSNSIVVGLREWMEEQRKTREEVRAVYNDVGLKDLPLEDLGTPIAFMNDEQEKVLALEHAASVLEASRASERIAELERRILEFRTTADAAALRLSTAEQALQSANQILKAAQSVPNEILVEQFETVMPLLRELYRRLRPHADWTEIGSDFGGKVRGTLNFTVGDGHNPQFLFSSGQRRAAGLAFLLAVHLSRPWCRWNSLVLDDPVQHVDDYRALNLVELLSSIRRSGRQVLIAIEDAALADLLCRRLRGSVTEPGRRFDLAYSHDGGATIEAILDISPLSRDALKLIEPQAGRSA